MYIKRNQISYQTNQTTDKEMGNIYSRTQSLNALTRLTVTCLNYTLVPCSASSGKMFSRQLLG